MRTASVALVLAAIALGGSPAVAQNADQVKLVFEHPLPNIEGKRMVAVVVTYPPGGKSPAHRHAPSAFIYAHVLSGTIRSQVGDEPAKVYHAGEGFYEMPGSHHRISENASGMASAPKGGEGDDNRPAYSGSGGCIADCDLGQRHGIRA
jgi:quercetin dioxygenase-like cupin family protein